MATRIQPLITVAELDACPDDGNRYELIEGELFVRFSRSQIIGALILLVLIWAVILFRMLSSGA